MNNCYLIASGSSLPGEPIQREQIQSYLGRLDGEDEVKDRVLRMNGIVLRHYAQDRNQHPTADVISMASSAVRDCLENTNHSPTLLTAGTTYSPFSGPGIASLIHAELGKSQSITSPLEVSSHGGICSSGAAALVHAVRAIQCGDHRQALAVGSEHASEVLKSSVICPIDDRAQHCGDVRRSKWFMSVFLRFMLSDGAGAVLLSDRPSTRGPCMRVDWAYSRSFAHDTERCMTLENRSGLLSQDVSVLSRYLLPRTATFLQAAFQEKNESIDQYDVVLPHLSSFFFRRRMEKIMRTLSAEDRLIPYWTNLASAGNTGAASIFVMLDEYRRKHEMSPGHRLLLFIPESGQFNFVLISLTVVDT